MPDFVVSTAKMPFMQKMHEQILPFDCKPLRPSDEISANRSKDEKMRRFTLDMSKGVKPNAEIIPPPQMSHLTLPFNYSCVTQVLFCSTVDTDDLKATVRTLMSCK